MGKYLAGLPRAASQRNYLVYMKHSEVNVKVKSHKVLHGAKLQYKMLPLLTSSPSALMLFFSSTPAFEFGTKATR